MKILVTGASGFIGSYLVDKLLEYNFEVLAIVRSNVNLNCNVILIDNFDSSTDLSEFLQDIDVFIHLAAKVHLMNHLSVDVCESYKKINTDLTYSLAKQAANSGVKRFIFLSTIKVNGEYTFKDNPFKAENFNSSLSVYKKAQKCREAFLNDPYSKSKYDAEQALQYLSLNSNLEIVIIRPPLVYGRGVRGNFDTMVKVVKKEFPLPFKYIKNKRSLVFVGNLISLIICTIEHPMAVNQIFLVSDREDISTSKLLCLIYKKLNIKSRLFFFPSKFMKLLFYITGKKNVYHRLFGSLQVDISKTCDVLNWSPPFTLEEGIDNTLKS